MTTIGEFLRLIKTVLPRRGVRPIHLIVETKLVHPDGYTVVHGYGVRNSPEALIQFQAQ